MLNIGDKAPEINLPDNNGNIIKLSDFRGKKVVVYFYPRDNTPGCTKEACSIRDVYDEILDTGAVVIGISPDIEQTHTKFKSRYNIPFYLLSDKNKEAARTYGALFERKMFGKLGIGVQRSTFIIDEDGTIIKLYPKVKPEIHGKEILEYLQKN